MLSVNNISIKLEGKKDVITYITAKNYTNLMKSPKKRERNTKNSRSTEHLKKNQLSELSQWKKKKIIFEDSKENRHITFKKATIKE